MLEGKLIIIPALGHQKKGKSNFTGSGLFVSMSQCGNNNKLAKLAKGLFADSNEKLIIYLQKVILELMGIPARLFSSTLEVVFF